MAGQPELAHQVDYATNSLRVANRAALVPQVVAIMQQQTTVWWLAQLNEVGVPCGPICTIDQVFDNPQIQARDMQLELDHVTLGKVASVANPIKYSATPIQYTQAPPTLGQHTDEVLKDWLGE